GGAQSTTMANASSVAFRPRSSGWRQPGGERCNPGYLGSSCHCSPLQVPGASVLEGQENGPAHFGRPLKSSNNPYGAWESPGKRATPAQVNVLGLRRHSCSEALFHCECVTALRERRVTSFVTLQRGRHGFNL